MKRIVAVCGVCVLVVLAIPTRVVCAQAPPAPAAPAPSGDPVNPAVAVLLPLAGTLASGGYGLALTGTL